MNTKRTQSEHTPNTRKRHKSLRIDEALDERIRALRSDGESDAAAYARVLAAGVAALEDGAAPAAAASSESALLDYIETLKAQVAIKDEQIGALTRLTEQAQALQAVQAAKQLGDGSERLGAWQRFKRLFTD